MTLTEKINAAYACQEVENLQATHSYLHAASRSYEEWAYIWSKSDDCSWGHAFGRMHGFQEVWNGNVGVYDANCYGNYIKRIKKYPEIGGLDPRPLMGVAMHTLCNGIIEVAEDGLSARASFFTPGTLGGFFANDDYIVYAGSLWERYGADYVCEDGKWLFLHQQVCPDFSCNNFDSANAARESYLCEAGEAEAMSGFDSVDDPLGYHIPFCSEPGPIHRDYSVCQTCQNTVPWPEPYASLSDVTPY